jgi:dienelactone hydrolase
MSDLFADLLLLRKGGEGMMMGAGPTVVEPLRTPEEWAVKAAALRELFGQTLGEQPPVECPLDLRLEQSTDRGGHVERRYSYAVAPDERVAALALVPKGLSAPAPAMLCIHSTHAWGKLEVVGRGGDFDTSPGANRSYALELARRGYVAFAPDLLGSGERIYPGRRHFDNEPFYEKHPRWSGTGKDLWDMRRALDVMEALPEVDRARIGSIGHSQGGGITCYLMAVDARVRVGVSNCGFWPHRITKNPFGVARTGWWIGRPALRPHFLCGKPAPVDYHELLALAAPRPFFKVSSLAEYGYTAADEPFTRAAWEDLARNVNAVYALLGAPGGFRLAMHLGPHDFPAPLRAEAYAFIDAALRRAAASG